MGWGSTYGPIVAAVRRARKQGARVAHAHFHYLNPFPANTGDVLRRYPKVLVPEMNLGQLALLLRAEFLVDAVSYTRPWAAADGRRAPGRDHRDGGGGMKNGNGLVQLTAKDFKSDQEVRWCPGCGDYAILAGVQSFLPELGIPRENLVFVSASAVRRASRTTSRPTGCTRSTAARPRSRRARDRAPRPLGLGRDG